MFNSVHEKWSLEEKIRLLEMFIDKDNGSILWEERANKLQEEFGGKRPTDFFTQATVKRELNNIFNKPNPEHHIFGLPTHPRGKEAAELWLKHYRRELEETRRMRIQLFMVAMRKQLDMIRRYQQGKLPKEELDAVLEEARERDAKRPDKEQYEARIKQYMAKAYFQDFKNVRTFADYFRFIRGVRIPTPARSPTPVKVLVDDFPELILESFQESKDVRKTVIGHAESADTSAKQQRMPRMHVAATPPTEKPKARKRKADSGDESKEIDVQLDKPSEKRRRPNKKEPVDNKSMSSSTLSSPLSFVATPSQPLFSEVAATAKLRSQLRRAALASATPSPAVDSVADNRLFLKPGKLLSNEVLPKQILLTLWRDIHSHRYAPVFSFPVSEELVRGYHTAIKRPMDLKTLKSNIESGEVNTLAKFSHAILKMYANAVMYNSTGHYVNNYAKELAAYTLKCIEVVQFPAGQFHIPPPSRQSNGSSSEGGAVGGGSSAKFSIAWATTLVKPKGVSQKNTKNRNDEEKFSTSSSQEVKMEANQCDDGETRHLFQRRRLYNQKYTFSATL